MFTQRFVPLAIAALTLAGLMTSTGAAQSKKPNIVVIWGMTSASPISAFTVAV